MFSHRSQDRRNRIQERGKKNGAPGPGGGAGAFFLEHRGARTELSPCVMMLDNLHMPVTVYDNKSPVEKSKLDAEGFWKEPPSRAIRSTSLRSRMAPATPFARALCM